jgi:glycosyltransferase involved in cell wall biosynthesis
LRYHYQANAHLGAARNTGQRLAGGEALLFLDSDDLLLPDALDRLEGALASDRAAALAFTRSQTIDENGAVTEPLWDYVTYAGDVWCDLIMGNFIRSAGSALVRRSALEQAGAWKVKRELGGNEDWEMWLRLAERAPFVRVDEPLFQYRVHGTGLSANEPINYHWAMVVLEMHRLRNRDNPVRLAALARAYDRFHEGTRHRWRLAARQDWQSRRWRSALSRQWYLLRLDRAHRRTTRALAPFRVVAQPVTT